MFLAKLLPLLEKLVPFWQLLPLPGKEAFLPRQVLPLPEKPVPLWQLLSFQGKGSSSSQVTALPPLRGKEAIPPRLFLSLIPLGPPRQVKLAIQPGLLGKAVGTPPVSSTQASQEVNTTSQEGKHFLHPPSRPPQGSSHEEPNPKWVINLSNKPLTPAQRSVLAKGPNFAVTPRQPPNLEYITAIEAACTKLSQQDAEELRADINRVLRSSHPPNPT